MRFGLPLLMLAMLVTLPPADARGADAPRVIVTTDIGGDPDDAMSLVRFLTYANQWQVDGLIATAYQRTKVEPQHIRAIVDAYARVRENLEQHEPGFPTAEHLRSVIREGRPAWGMTAVGAGMDSPGSELIIEAVDRADPRPVWVLVWGGPNCLAQALWKARATRTPEALAAFVAKLRVYAISDQDDSGPWIREQFPTLFYIASPGMHAGGGFHHSTWIGIGGDKFHGRFGGANFTIVDNPWLDEHVRRKGPLGAMYPQWKFMMEGDSPSFLYLVDNGLGSPDHPDWGSWGGRYELHTPRKRKWMIQAETRPFWADTEDEVLGTDGEWHTTSKATIWRWRTAYQHDFSARMDWTIKARAEANHPPVATLDHPPALTVKSGERVTLSARASTDPDGDALRYDWFYYGEPSSILLANGRTGAPLTIDGHETAVASFAAPKVTAPATMHIVLALTDTGSPTLTRYRRVVVTVVP